MINAPVVRSLSESPKRVAPIYKTSNAAVMRDISKPACAIRDDITPIKFVMHAVTAITKKRRLSKRLLNAAFLSLMLLGARVAKRTSPLLYDKRPHKTVYAYWYTMRKNPYIKPLYMISNILYHGECYKATLFLRLFGGIAWEFVVKAV